MSALLSVDEAKARILGLIRPVGAEIAPLSPELVGRVLAEQVAAVRAQPPFAVSAMDGYAVRDADAAPGTRLRVVGEIAAGSALAGSVGPGEAARIFTGAPMPDGSERVVIQEQAARDGDWVVLGETLETARYVRPAGLDFDHGEVLVEAPKRLNPRDIALIAAAGRPYAAVSRRPRVALVASGDELVWPGDPRQAAAVATSNNFGLAAMALEAGALPELTPIAPDEPKALEAVLERAAAADLIVTMGGASVGDHDLMAGALGRMGADMALHRIAMRPGKPLMAGTLGGKPLIGLPGNPVSAMVCGVVFVLPALRALLGLPVAAEVNETLPLAAPLPANGPREHYMRAQIMDGMVKVFEDQDSSRLRLLSQADALAARPAHAPAAAAGERVRVLRF